MKASGDLGLRTIALLRRVRLAPVNVRAHGEVVLRPDAGFALWALARVFHEVVHTAGEGHIDSPSAGRTAVARPHHRQVH